MNAEDIRVGQRVRVTVDPTRYEASDYAYLTRRDHPRRNPEPSVEDQTLTVFDFIQVELPTAHRMVVLTDDTGRKAYLAEDAELRLAECFIRDGWCSTHNVAESFGHYLDTRPPEDRGHNPRTGIAYND